MEGKGGAPNFHFPKRKKWQPVLPKKKGGGGPSRHSRDLEIRPRGKEKNWRLILYFSRKEKKGQRATSASENIGQLTKKRGTSRARVKDRGKGKGFILLCSFGGKGGGFEPL